MPCLMRPCRSSTFMRSPQSQRQRTRGRSEGKPATSTGVLLLTVVPSPSWPEWLDPQHRIAPARSSAHVCSAPAAIAAMPLDSPRTSTGECDWHSWRCRAVPRNWRPNISFPLRPARLCAPGRFMYATDCRRRRDCGRASAAPSTLPRTTGAQCLITEFSAFV